MSSDTVISVEGLSKSYLIGHDGPQERYHSLRDTVVRHGRNYVRKAVDMARGRQIIQGDSVEEFWALKDVSFEVKRGEVLGIIGRNGAGKSTLLKILSRITEPTSGRVVLDGRVASLLEVGTGFHPELTGRENIFLNGAILGMGRAEIRQKFDEIVDFAGVEKFLDTPVKRYSSGMYVRLAFAVAAHLEPEILIIDEVLAVGDAEFQKKCLGKMQDVAKAGRTVLFVSHNLGAIQSLCSRALVMKSGTLVSTGTPREAISYYQDASENLSSQSEINHKAGTLQVEVLSITTKTEGREISNSFLSGEPIDVEIEVLAKVEQTASFFLLIKDSEDRIVYNSFQQDNQDPFTATSRHLISTQISGFGFCPGTYTIEVGAFDKFGGFHDWAELGAQFKIQPQFADGRPYGGRLGLIHSQLSWIIDHN